MKALGACLLAALLLGLAACAGVENAPAVPASVEEPAGSAGEETPANAAGSAAESAAPAGEGQRYDITTPIVLAHERIVLGEQEYTVQVTLLGGRYLYTQDNWRHVTCWQGEAEFRVTGSSLPEPVLTVRDIACNGPFALFLSDYNGDGQPDFTLLSAWGNYSHSYYEILTIEPDGSLQVLPIAAESAFEQDIFLTVRLSPAQMSLPLYREEDGTSFSVAVYHNGGGGPDDERPLGYYRQRYRWRDDEYVLASSEHVGQEEGRMLAPW